MIQPDPDLFLKLRLFTKLHKHAKAYFLPVFKLWHVKKKHSTENLRGVKYIEKIEKKSK